MQAKPLHLESPRNSVTKHSNVLGVLSNSNVTTPLVTKAPSILNCKQVDPQQPSNLENENQSLKSQVDLLKSLLVGMVKNQNVEHPLLDLSPSKMSLEELVAFTKSTQKQKSPPKGSPKKLQQQSKENNVDYLFPDRCVNKQAESSQSPKRRRRSDRIKSSSPTKEQHTSVRKMRMSIQEMPLQVQQKDLTTITDMSQQHPNDFTLNQSNMNLVDDSARLENILDQNQTEELNENEDVNNSSQMHIKYAKMLEELENQSNYDNQQIQEVEDCNDLAQQLEITQTLSQRLSRTQHLKNKLSSQLEHKNFYELELEQLKQQLHECAQEEKKLLSMIVTTNPSDQIEEQKSSPIVYQEAPLKNYVDHHEDYSPKIRLLCIPVNGNIKESEEEEETFSMLSDRALREMTPVRGQLTTQDLLDNLKEEAEYIKMNDIDECDFMRPVKIGSPQNLSNGKFSQKYLENSGKKNHTFSSTKKTVEAATSQQDTVSSFDRRSPIQSKKCPSQLKSPTKRFSVQRTDIQESQKSPPKSPVKRSFQESNKKRAMSSHNKTFEMKRIGDYSDSNSKDDISNKSWQELDQLAKERALSKGLQQQEEPEDECSLDLDNLNHPKIINAKQYIGNYYGNLSKEKSDQLKNQRLESIKKAEELLLSNSKAEQQKRPDFISKYVTKQKSETTTPVRNGHEIHYQCQEFDVEETDMNNFDTQLDQQTPLIQLQNIPSDNFNDISFQDQEVAAINYVNPDTNSFNALSEGSSKYQTLVNIEIPSRLQTHEDVDLKKSPLKNPQVTLKYQAYINKNTSKSKEPLKHPMPVQDKLKNKSPLRTHKYNQTQNVFSNRKSLGNDCSSKKAQVSTAFLMQSMAGKSRTENQPGVGLNKSSNNPSYKTTPYKKDKQMSASKGQTICQAQPDAQPVNYSNFDAELLYQFRAKSVIKRREELLQKRELENRMKVQAKNDKIDRLKHSRNSRMSIQRSQREQQNSTLKIHECNESTSQISIEEPRYYQSNIDNYSHYSNSTQQLQRSSLPTTHSNISSRISNISSVPTSSQLVSGNTTYRQQEESSRIQNRKASISKTAGTHQLFKKNLKAYNQQLINRTMRISSQKEQQCAFKQTVNNHNSTTNPSLSTILHSSKSFIHKESASKTRQTEEHGTFKHNFKLTKGLSSSRSVNKLDLKSQYSSTQRDSLGIPLEAKRTCENCDRLRQKGLSTEFCLNHYETNNEQSH